MFGQFATSFFTLQQFVSLISKLELRFDLFPQVRKVQTYKIVTKFVKWQLRNWNLYTYILFAKKNFNFSRTKRSDKQFFRTSTIFKRNYKTSRQKMFDCAPKNVRAEQYFIIDVCARLVYNIYANFSNMNISSARVMTSRASPPDEFASNYFTFYYFFFCFFFFYIFIWSWIRRITPDSIRWRRHRACSRPLVRRHCHNGQINFTPYCVPMVERKTRDS